MSNPFLAVAIYVILWWLSFFMLLPVGAQSFHELDESAPPGVDPGAPRFHRLGLKAAAAAGIAAVLWLGVAWGISVNLLRVAPPA
jgi:predicted secreted protein